MNVKLLRKVKRAILKHPDQFEMDGWFTDQIWVGGRSFPAGGCGTAACIGGWAIHLSRKSTRKVSTTCKGFKKRDVLDSAVEALDLDQKQAANLFSIGGWPMKFWRLYTYAAGTQPKAKAAADRIDHFIKTKGAE